MASSAMEIESLKQSLSALRKEMQVDRRSVDEMRDKLSKEVDDRQREDSKLLQAIEALIKTLNQETMEGLTRFHEVQETFNAVRKSIEEVRIEVERTNQASDEFLGAINLMKRSFDQEQSDNVIQKREYSNWITEARKSVDGVRDECARQARSNEEVFRVLNTLKDTMDEEVQERIEHCGKLDKDVVEAATARQRLLESFNTNVESVRKDCLTQRSTTQDLMKVMNNIKDMFDRDSQANLVKHSEILKALEETHTTITEAVPSAGSKEALVRLRKLRKQTNDFLANPVAVVDMVEYKPPEALPIPPHMQMAAAPQEAAAPQAEAARQAAQAAAAMQMEQTLQMPATPQVAAAPLATPQSWTPQATSTTAGLTPASVSPVMFGKQVDQEEVASSVKMALEAVEQEKKERTASYGMLHSHMTNFQYDFAVERSERTRLHGDISALKQDVASMSQELRAAQLPDKDSLRRGGPPSALMGENRPALSSSASFADAGAIKETVREEVTQAFRDHQARHTDLSNLINSVSVQEKSERAAEISKIQEIVQGLGRRVEMQVLSNMGDTGRDSKDIVSREEFEAQCRRLWEAIGPDVSIPRDEFEGQVARLWEAIMHLQATQLEGIQRQTREDAFNNGLAMMGESSSPQRAPAALAALSSTIAPRSASNSTSPVKGGLARSSGRPMLGSQPYPTRGTSPSGSRSTAPFSENLLPMAESLASGERPISPRRGLSSQRMGGIGQ